MRLLVVLLILNVYAADCKSQSPVGYCRLDKGIMMTHLRLDGDGKFIVEDFVRYHSDVYETKESGSYILDHDTLFFLSNRILPKDSIAAFKSPDNAIGYHEKGTFYFGKGPYAPMKKCSEKRFMQLRKKL